MNRELQELEATLGAATPAAVPPQLVERIGAALAAGVRPADPAEKVVPFPAPRRVPASRAQPSYRWGWAAAAVAMAGALAAWLVPGDDAAEPVVVSSRKWHQSLPIPAARQSGPGPVVASQLGGVLDEGVVWARNGQPLRKVRVLYIDRHMARDRNGKPVEVSVPRVQYLLLPERID